MLSLRIEKNPHLLFTEDGGRPTSIRSKQPHAHKLVGSHACRVTIPVGDIGPVLFQVRMDVKIRTSKASFLPTSSSPALLVSSPLKYLFLSRKRSTYYSVNLPLDPGIPGLGGLGSSPTATSRCAAEGNSAFSHYSALDSVWGARVAYVRIYSLDVTLMCISMETCPMLHEALALAASGKHVLLAVIRTPNAISSILDERLRRETQVHEPETVVSQEDAQMLLPNRVMEEVERGVFVHVSYKHDFFPIDRKQSGTDRVTTKVVSEEAEGIMKMKMNLAQFWKELYRRGFVVKIQLKNGIWSGIWNPNPLCNPSTKTDAKPAGF
ncbi:hypothetical protein EV421DRAFT_1743594 [Armillaria borealis]|uniref:Uncharacterized protein n=1 Tax=Armillaria borealis TaxID=47425 RepID=A0AA39IUV9_9AGAR|nr:hypothetical protein EV421DRAFT_1743594 [Armillaria borealis]